MNGRKLYTIPKTNAPSPNGQVQEIRTMHTVASVRIRIFTHIGRMNSTTIVREVLKRSWLRI